MALKNNNLIPEAHKLTVEEQSAGGKKSGEVRKEKKKLKENFELLMTLPIKSAKAKEQLKSLGIEDDDINNQMAMVVSIYQKALKGDVNAFNTIRDTMGEKPVDKVENYNADMTINLVGFDEQESEE